MSNEPSLLPQPTNWPQGWHAVDPSVAGWLVAELIREVNSSHPLFGFSASAVARRFDRDDVLFIGEMDGPMLAEVHLTYRGTSERNPNWPLTTLYRRFEEWVTDQSPSRNDAH